MLFLTHYEYVISSFFKGKKKRPFFPFFCLHRQSSFFLLRITQVFLYFLSIQDWRDHSPQTLSLAFCWKRERENENQKKAHCCRELAWNYVLLLYYRVDFFFSKWIEENVIFVQIFTKNQPAATFIIIIFWYLLCDHGEEQHQQHENENERE